MGANLSNALPDVLDRHIGQDEISYELLQCIDFSRISDPITGKVPLRKLMQEFQNKTDVFLTHDWGLDQANHRFIRQINNSLKLLGLRTWFDDERMEGDTVEKMTRGIDNARLIVVFVTRRYMNKVDGENARDNCKLEFKYAANRKTSRKMLAVVRESDMRDTASWIGHLGMVLGSSLYVEFTDSDDFSTKIQELFNHIIMRLGGETLDSMLARVDFSMIAPGMPNTPNPLSNNVPALSRDITSNSSISSQNSPPVIQVATAIAFGTTNAFTRATAVSSKVIDSSDVQAIMELSDWFRQHIKIHSSLADKYAGLLFDNAIGMISKLHKKLSRNEKFLEELGGFDEDDIDTIKQVLLCATNSRVEDHAVAVAVAKTSHGSISAESGSLASRLVVREGKTAGSRKMEMEELKALNLSLRQILDLGYTVRELKDLGEDWFSLQDLIAADVDWYVLIDAGYSYDALKQAGCPARAFRDMGVDVKALLDLNFSRKEIYTVKELLGKGLTVLQLKENVGFDVRDLYASGVSIMDLLDANIEVCQLREASIPLVELKKAGISADALRNAGFNEEDFKQAGELEAITWTPRLVKTMVGHSKTITGIAFLPGTSRIITTSLDKSLKIWDLHTGECVKTIVGHKGYVECLALLPSLSPTEPARVVTGANDLTLKVWNVENGHCLSTLSGHTDKICCVAVIPANDVKGIRVISASCDRTLKVWDIHAETCVQTLTGYSNAVYCVAVVPDGSLAISGGKDNSARIWDLVTGVCTRICSGHTSAIFGITVVGDGKLVATSSGDNTVRVWDILTGRCMHILSGHRAGVSCVASIPHMPNLVISGSFDRALKIWNIETGKCMHTLTGHSGRVTRVAVADDKRIVSGGGGDDKSLKVFSIL